MKVVHCTTSDCTTNDAPTTLVTNGDGTGLSITVGDDTNPIISYYDIDDGAMNVLHCADQACTSNNPPLEFDRTGGGSGETTSITIGADGNPVVSFQDGRDSDLHVVHCDNRLCVPHHRPR